MKICMNLKGNKNHFVLNCNYHKNYSHWTDCSEETKIGKIAWLFVARIFNSFFKIGIIKNSF